MRFRLLRRFIDAPRLAAQQADEEERQFLRAIGADTEPPGEPEYQELLRLLSSNLPSAPPGQDEGTKTENVEEALDQCGGGVVRDGIPFETPVIPAKAGIHGDISSRIFQSAEMEALKMNDRCGNLYENKGALWKTGAEAGMLQKTNLVTRKMQESH